MGRIGAVIFDMDGVIFDTERVIIECWKPVAEKYGLSDIETVCYRCIGVKAEVTRANFREAYGGDFPYEERQAEVSRLFHEQYGGGRIPIKPGVTVLLYWLKEQGIPVALASSTRRDIVRQELSDAGLLQFFDQVICGDMVSKSKPAPDIFLKAAHELGAEAPDCCVIEDSYNGIRAAHAAGMRPVMVPDLLPPSEEIRSLCETVLPSLNEVKSWIEQRI